MGGSGCIKNKRGTRHASRARNTPQYIIACQGADVKGNGARARGQKRVGAKAVREAREAREGGGWRGRIGIKKLVRTTPYRAQK